MNVKHPGLSPGVFIRVCDIVTIPVDFALRGVTMPRLSQFYGIAIYMYYRDHAPPHFHAIYGDDEAVFEIATGSIMAGKLSRRARLLVEDWLAQHRDALQWDWDLAVTSQPLVPIPPLD